MATQVKTPTIAQSIAESNHPQWNAVSYVYASDDAYAYCVVDPLQSAISEYLSISGFGFTIPSEATIDGIKVEIERKAKYVYGDGPVTHSVCLEYNGSIIGNCKGEGAQWTASDAWESRGGATDKWEVTPLTPAILNHASFGVRVKTNFKWTEVERVYIDNIKITVYFTCPSITVTTTSVPNALKGNYYSETVVADGACLWSIASGSLPTGLDLNEYSGLISGTPSAVGTFNFTVRATSLCDGSYDDQALSIEVTCPPIEVITTVLPDAYKEVYYAQTLQASQPGTWSIVSGSLPSGLNLTGATGAITGIPTATGTSSFTVRVTSSCDAGYTDDQALSITVKILSAKPVKYKFDIVALSKISTPFTGENFTQENEKRVWGSGEGDGEFEFAWDGNESEGDGRFEGDFDFLFTGTQWEEGYFDADHELVFTGDSDSDGIADFILYIPPTSEVAYILNLDTKRTYPFSNYGFLGFGRFKDNFYGCDENGIFDLETFHITDDEAVISAYVEIETDFGIRNKKEFRSIFVADYPVRVTITDYADYYRSANIQPDEFRSWPNEVISKGFSIKVENIEGQRIILRSIQGKINPLAIKGEGG